MLMDSCVVNVKSTRKCAFCKYWYDPANSGIAPKSPTIGLWEIKNVNQKNLCTKRNMQMSAFASCGSGFVCKI